MTSDPLGATKYCKARECAEVVDAAARGWGAYCPTCRRAIMRERESGVFNRAVAASRAAASRSRGETTDLAGRIATTSRQLQRVMTAERYDEQPRVVAATLADLRVLLDEVDAST